MLRFCKNGCHAKTNRSGNKLLCLLSAPTMTHIFLNECHMATAMGQCLEWFGMVQNGMGDASMHLHSLSLCVGSRTCCMLLLLLSSQTATVKVTF